MPSISRERVERAARLYTTNQDATTALDIARESFPRLCRRYGIETPYRRKLRQNRERRARAEREATDDR